MFPSMILLIYAGGNIWQEVKAEGLKEEPRSGIGKNEDKREPKPKLMTNSKL